MYCENDVKRLFILRGEMEMELKMRIAQEHNPLDPDRARMEQRISVLKRQLDTIDSLFSVLSQNERFIVEKRLLDGLEWPQIAKLYAEQWDVAEEKTIRSYQIYLTKALKKIAEVLNRRILFIWDDILPHVSPKTPLDEFDTKLDKTGTKTGFTG